MNLEDLKAKLPYKWKIQSLNNKEKKLATKASCVAYIDARDVMDILDKVCGPENWQDKYEFVGTKLIAGVGIAIARHDSGGGHFREWVWKYDTGTESDYEAEKGQFSDAFKRAAVKWGVGRFLYDLKVQWVDVHDTQPIIPANFNNLTEYCNARSEGKYPLSGNKSPATAPKPPQTPPKAPQSTAAAKPSTNEQIKEPVEVGFKIQSLENPFGTAVCSICNSSMWFNEGVSKKTGKKYTQLKCSTNHDHLVWYPKVENALNYQELLESNKVEEIIIPEDLPF